MRFDYFDLGGVRLHVASTGDPGAPLTICLHGFPEYWAAWKEVMERLSDRFHMVAPDQRGFNLSDKPTGQGAYAVRNMVADLAALADRLSPGKPFVLAGHDWGASGAYAYAFAHPERLSRLVIANGPHPVAFQRAILEDPAQRRASQYFLKLRAPGAAARMAEDDFARTMRMFRGFSATPWLTDEDAAAYRAAWAQPGAMEAMLRWYSSSPIVVPEFDESRPDAPVPADVPLLAVPDEKVTVRVPHLVVWGEADEALRPSCIEGLERYAPDLTIVRVKDAGHWILHEKPGEVAEAVRAWVG